MIKKPEWKNVIVRRRLQKKIKIIIKMPNINLSKITMYRENKITSSNLIILNCPPVMWTGGSSV